jgi:hypothetical protein
VVACVRHGVPLVARVAGTGRSGANAVDGCVVVSLEKMNRILVTNPLERLAVVEYSSAATTCGPPLRSRAAGTGRTRRTPRVSVRPI